MRRSFSCELSLTPRGEKVNRPRICLRQPCQVGRSPIELDCAAEIGQDCRVQEHAISTQSNLPAADSWRLIGRVFLKALLLFAALNLLFAAIRPLDTLGQVSLYNLVFPGRARLPYGEVPQEDYNLTLQNLPAMMASHTAARPKASDEYRVLIIGDSATWGWFLENEYTLAGQINKLGLRSDHGRRVVAYNLGYPVMSLTKDLLWLDLALEKTDPDLVIWPVTLQSFARTRQLEHPLLHENAGRVRGLIDQYGLAIDTTDSRFRDRTLPGESLIGRRRDIADLLRLQAWGLAWAATGHDQAIPDAIPSRQTDLEADESWLDIAHPRVLTDADLAFDVLTAGIERVGDLPIVIINEPMYISDGNNSHIRYNSFYPRWAYDQYRALLPEAIISENVMYLDLWNTIPSGEFTDTPVHLTPKGTQLLAERLVEGLADLLEPGTPPGQ